MVVVKLQGGLGNQLFQYAAARGLAKGNNTVYLDLQFLEANKDTTEHFSARPYSLGIFKNLEAKKATAFQLNFFKKTTRFYRMLRIAVRQGIKIIQQQENELLPFETHNRYTYFYLDGYFQSEKYFKQIRKQLLAELKFPLLDVKNEAVKNEILAITNPVSVHIRRGDYVSSSIIADVLPVLPLTYYECALAVLQSKCTGLSLFIFSDDIDWTKKYFKPSIAPIHYVDINHAADAWKDMALMSYCKHHIIANSSFSWWGAWLCQREGFNFAPSAWFNSKKINFNINDIVPESWIIINAD